MKPEIRGKPLAADMRGLSWLGIPHALLLAAAWTHSDGIWTWLSTDHVVLAVALVVAFAAERRPLGIAAVVRWCHSIAEKDTEHGMLTGRVLVPDP